MTTLTFRSVLRACFLLALASLAAGCNSRDSRGTGPVTGGGATCAQVCQQADALCGAAGSCASDCPTLSQAERNCIVAATACQQLVACDGATGGTDSGIGRTDSVGTDGVGTDSGGAECRCEGSINDDPYAVNCGETFCADGLERRCASRANVVETGETCSGGFCAAQRESCGDGVNCCDIPGASPVCMDGSCCQLSGPATASSNCCFITIEDDFGTCCVTSADSTCGD